MNDVLNTAGAPREFNPPDYIKALVQDLRVEDKLLPMRPETMLEKYGIQAAARLVDELVEQNATGGVFFQRACSLVRPEELGVRTRKWFEKNGLHFLDDNIYVMPSVHANEIDLHACHEIGEYVIDGRPSVRHYDKLMLIGPPKYIDDRVLHLHYPDEEFPHGRIAEIRPWTRIRFSIPATYIAGKSQSARGILCPPEDGDPKLYISADDAFAIGTPTRKFSVANSGIHKSIWWATEGVGNYLRGRTPSKRDYLLRGGQEYA